MKFALFTIVLLTLSFIVHCVPLTDFFPYGPTANDYTMEPALDEFIGPISLPYIFPFFDNNHREIFLGNNGLFSFIAGVSQFVPESFPLNDSRQIIGGFWADVDTRGQSTTIDGVYNKVYYQVYTNLSSSVFDKTSSFVQQYFPNERPFQPKLIITATWYRVGTYPQRTDSLNTFQIILATDELRSFTFFHYHDIQWAYTNSTSTAVFNYAQAGFDAGDGMTYKMLPHSRTADIVKLVNESNVNIPGLFVYRIDTFDIEAGGCEGDATANNTKYSYLPIRGSQLGGTSVNIHGPCFSMNDSVKCQFGSYETVDGLALNRFLVRCIAPIAEFIGVVNLSISLDNGTTYRFLGQYTYMTIPLNFVADVQVRNTSNLPVDNLLSWNQTITLDWFFSSSTFDSLPANSTLSIEYVEIDSQVDITTTKADAPLRIRQIIELETGVAPHLGHQSITIDLNRARARQTRLAFLPLALGFLRFSVYAVVTVSTNILIWKEEIADVGCNKWSAAQPTPTTWNQDLLPCPYTRTQASAAGCCYTVDKACKLGASCWFHQGRPQFQEESAVECYRSKGTNSHGAGGQCCYGQNGQLITTGTGAGSDDRYHSTDQTWKHLFHDVLPFIACCKVSRDPEMCDTYLRYRPPRRGSNTNPQNGGAWGDPHYQTLDGLTYTFNGYGEYTYLAILDGDTITSQEITAAFDSTLNYTFMSQVRTVPLAGPENKVTVIKAFAAKSNILGSQPIRIVVSRREHLLVYRGNETLDLEPNLDSVNSNQTILLTFSDVTIEKEPVNGTITLTWPIGISVKVSLVNIVSPAAALVLNIVASLSSTFQGKTYGLLGNYDGNSANDLRNKNGQVIPSNSTTEKIHGQFGTTWDIDPTKSMMYYEHNDTAFFYSQQNINYTPLFSLPRPSNDNLARQICHIDPEPDSSTWTTAQWTCFFDLAVTNDQAFAQSSFIVSQELQEIRESQRNPPEFDSSLPLEMSVTIGTKFSLHFKAISEFSETILYEAERSPAGSIFNTATGVFEWQVPKTFDKDRTSVRIRAQDYKYNLTSSHEVLLYIKAGVGSGASMVTTLSYLIRCLLIVFSAAYHS